LNVILVRGNDRWLDDVGTGSYVDPSLHWYRSTLAHNAPLVDGRSQRRVHGSLDAYEDRGAAGWVRAFVDSVAPGVRLERTLVAMPNYVIDELTWVSNHDATVDLPMHVDGDLVGVGEWRRATPDGGTEAEDGFGFLTAARPRRPMATLGFTRGSAPRRRTRARVRRRAARVVARRILRRTGRWPHALSLRACSRPARVDHDRVGSRSGRRRCGAGRCQRIGFTARWCPA
jgi:hypothetical protein